MSDYDKVGTRYLSREAMAYFSSNRNYANSLNEFGTRYDSCGAANAGRILPPDERAAVVEQMIAEGRL